MKKVVITSVLIVFVFVSWAVAAKNFYDKGIRIPFLEAKCGIPIEYSVGSIDPSFGISKEQFVSSIKQAEQSWESALGKNVLDYSEGNGLKVNLVFDQRQAETERLRKMLREVDLSKGKYESLEAKYNSLVLSLDQKKKDYENLVLKYEKETKAFDSAFSEYEKDLAEYNKKVQSWNSKGGAPESEYKKLQDEKEDLDSTLSALKKKEDSLGESYNSLERKRKELNNMISEINSLGNIVNQLGGKVNENIEGYNDAQASRGEFETGLYKKEGMKEEIDIYQFFDEKDLIAILAHEFGHAFGLEHTAEPSSIMYPILGENNYSISKEDVKIFKMECE